MENKWNLMFLVFLVFLVIFIIMIFSCKKENFESSSLLSMKTCYPTGSADVADCFKQPQNMKNVDGVYITAAKVGKKACPWDNGGDPAYWDIIKQKKKETNMKVWGILNMTGSDDLPSWKDISKCLKGTNNQGDSRNNLFDGLLIDAENLTPEQCSKISDLSYLQMPTLSTVGSGTCQNYRNPQGHGYIAMCYDGAEKNAPCSDCSDNKLKGVKINKFMYSINQWPNKPCSNKPIDIYRL